MVKEPIRSHEATVGEASVRSRTGRGREEWFALLDEAGAAAWDHPAIARWLAQEHGVDPWWCQSLTVGYEQARGMRAPGQRPDGTFEAGTSVTLPVPVDEAFAWFTDPERLTRWLDVDPVLRGATAGKTVRWTWPDGARVHVGLTALGPTALGPRTRVAVTHRGLADAADVPERKAFWSARLAALRALTAPGDSVVSDD